MNNVFCIALFLMGSVSLKADQTSAYRQATELAAVHLEKAKKAAQQGDPKTVPGYKAGLPPEASLNAGTLEGAAMAAAAKDPAAISLLNNSMEKQKFTVDGREDFIQNGDRAVRHPEKAMGGEITLTQQGATAVDGQETLTCFESGDEYTQTCTKHLEIEIEVTPEQGTTRPTSCIGHWKSKWRGTKWYCGGCVDPRYVVTQPKKVAVVKEMWVDGCAVLEDHADQGVCRYAYKENGPAETRTIEGEPITRDHWVETYTYACLKKIPDAQEEKTQSCAALRARGCTQTHSTCTQRMENTCVLWRQTFVCPNKKPKVVTYKAAGENVPFCLGGDCANATFEANGEILEVMSHLSILNQAQKDMRAGIGVFTGQVRACRKNCTGFRDCCTTGKGWGVSMSLAECTSEEKELADLRQKQHCILVGTYCAEKIAGVCIRKKTSFCCFGTKLSKLIQEQGRAQLGLNFGTAKCPDCRGLSPDELSRLDFSKMDLSALYEDIQKNIKIPESTQVVGQNSLSKIKENMKNLTANLTQNPPQNTQKGEGP